MSTIISNNFHKNLIDNYIVFRYTRCLAAGTLYGAISNMVEKGWISAVPGEESSRKKEYVITEQGKIIVRNELIRLKELAANGENIIGR